jgi:cytoskeletal protein CcmA (bactofilin family)
MSLRKDSTSPEDVSILSGGVKIEGNFYSEGNVRIDGKIKGNVIITGSLTLGEHCVIEGEVSARNITLSGRVEGKVFANEKVKLEPKSVLKGDLITKYLIVEEGAVFEGRSMMKNEAAIEQQN